MNSQTSRDAMYTLVIIDMQVEFEAASQLRVRRSIVQEIKAAREAQCPIVVVEYEESGPTYQNIRKALANYGRRARVMKDCDDGSQEIQRILPKLTNSKKLRLCGVHTDVCVLSTAKGLKRKGYSVEVATQGCAAENTYDHETGLWQLEQLGVLLLNSDSL